METQNSNLVQSNNIFENAEPSDLKFFVVTTFLPFSQFLVSHLMEKSSEMNSLKECKKALKIYAIATIVILSLIIGIVSAVTSPPDSLTSRFKTSLEMKVGYSETPLPRINVPIQKVYAENHDTKNTEFYTKKELKHNNLALFSYNIIQLEHLNLNKVCERCLALLAKLAVNMLYILSCLVFL